MSSFIYILCSLCFHLKGILESIKREFFFLYKRLGENKQESPINPGKDQCGGGRTTPPGTIQCCKQYREFRSLVCDGGSTLLVEKKT